MGAIPGDGTISGRRGGCRTRAVEPELSPHPDNRDEGQRRFGRRGRTNVEVRVSARGAGLGELHVGVGVSQLRSGMPMQGEPYLLHDVLTMNPRVANLGYEEGVPEDERHQGGWQARAP